MLPAIMVLVIMPAAWGLAAAPQESGLPGRWIGEFSAGGRTVAVKLWFRMEDGRVVGSADALNPLAGIRNAALKEITGNDGRAGFVLSYQQKDHSFTGTMAAGEMIGTVSAGGDAAGDFRFIRYRAPDPAALQQVQGYYEIGTGEYLSVFEMEQPGGMRDLCLHQHPSGRFAPLVALDGSRYAAISSMTAAFPVDYRLEFNIAPSSGVPQLILEGSDGARRSASRAAGYGVREVSFANRETLLRGDLWLPPGSGPHPAIVLIHGSGPGPRIGLVPMAQFLVRRGFAALIYDKRGCGASTGDWRKAGFYELAEDALAAVAHLARDPGVDSRRIGLYGISQGGWVAPLAASLSENVAFVVAHSGPGVTPAEQDTFTMFNSLKAAGLAEDRIAQVTAAYNLVYDYAATRRGAEKLDAAVEELRRDPLLGRIAPPRSTELENLEELYARQPVGDPGWYMHLDVRHDPLAVYRKVKCPVYCIFGEYDWAVPVAKSASGIEQALREAGHRDFTIRVFSGGGHGLLAMSGPRQADIVSPARVVPGLFEALGEWLRRFR
ncbi:MAG: alpha/beta fold hydrolase [Acidobacteria bacterium]|nr:alpha/beta fold hydrolase [Acidobacteriota bacterium]